MKHIQDEGIAYIGTFEFIGRGANIRSVGVFLRHPPPYGFISKGGQYVGRRSELQAETAAFERAAWMASDLGLDRLTVRSALGALVSVVHPMLVSGECRERVVAQGDEFDRTRWVIHRLAESFRDGIVIERVVPSDDGLARARFLAMSAIPPSEVDDDAGPDGSVEDFNRNGSPRR